MKIALRLLTLALCVFAWIENSMLCAKPQPCKPSADPIFHGELQPQSYTWIELTGEFAALPFPCPAERKCL